MMEFLTDSLHIFVVVMIAGFIIFSTMALNGKFDHWDSRFIQKAKQVFGRIRRYFYRNRKRETLHQKDNYEGNRHEHTSHHETHTSDNESIQ